MNFFILINYLKSIFFFGIVYLNFVGWSCNSWFMIWVVMELSFTFFIGFSCVDVSYSVVELLMKYYIIQVFVSLLFITTILISSFSLSFSFISYLFVILMAKIGLFPFHFWTISILGKLSWFAFLLLMTFMKLLPILMVSYLSIQFGFSFIILVSYIFSSVFGINNVVIQKLMGYSSLVHVCWLILSLMFSLDLFFLYFFCYFLMMLVFTKFFDAGNFYYFNQFKMMSGGLVQKFFIFFLVLSLAGFPPFMGFIIKWMVVSFLIFYDMKFLIFIMLSFSLFSVLFYLELFYYLMLMSSLNLSWYGNISLFFSWLFFFILLFYVSLFFLF